MASDDVVASSWYEGLLTAMSNFGRDLEQEMVLNIAHRAAFTLARHGVCSGTVVLELGLIAIFGQQGERLAVGERAKGQWRKDGRSRYLGDVDRG